MLHPCLSVSTAPTLSVTDAPLSTDVTDAPLSTGGTVAPLFNDVSVAPLSTGVTVATTCVITFIVAVIIGFAAGFSVSTLCSHKKAMKSSTAEGQANVGPTVPAGPVYEEVSLKKEEIELNTNNAYWQVGQ